MSSKHLFIILFSLLLITAGYSQDKNTQTVKGVVIDRITKETLPGANVILLDHEPLIGTSTDSEGRFELHTIPVGRHTFKISFLGYQPKVISEILVTGGREVFLTIELEEEIFEGEGVEVIADIPKDEPVNDMSYVSAKAFTVEETRRYAGGLDDPGRLVTAFAGVTSSGGTQSNAISIRGNAPKSVQWRLQGIEIPNPSHFAGLSVAGGGGLSLFSAELLSDSDFMTGAFPAEYGNALSGVFDINFRTGNKERREHAVKLGINGLEASSGGPFRKSGNATYLFNYRFSTLTLLMPLLPTEGFIRYQDVSFNLDFPTQKSGRFNVWGIGGLDNQGLDAKTDTTQWEYAYWDFSDNEIRLGVGAVGISHSLLVNKKGYLKTTIAYSGNSTDYREDQLDSEMNIHPHLRINNYTSRLAVKTYLNQKISRQNQIRTGIEYQRLFYDISLKGRPGNAVMIQQLSEGKGQSDLLQAYLMTEHDFTHKWSTTAGIHAQWFAVSKELLMEPRASIRYKPDERSAFYFGYGLHSQIEELSVYFVQDGNSKPNKDLKLAKSHHFVAGYSRYLGQNHHLNIELFDQHLFDVPVIADSSFSMLNFLQDFTFNDALVNEGKGRNSGVELTLERYLSDGYYYLLTGTWYKSRYQGGDGLWRDSRFDQNIAANVLYGKEFILNNGRRIFGVNVRGSVTGGERYSPVDEFSSTQQQRVVFDGVRAYNNQFDTRFVADLSIYFRKEHKQYSSEWSLMIKNVLMAKDYSFDYNYQTQQVDLIEEGTILPVLSWKAEF